MATRVARLSILDSYGVRWTRETFARDLLQNFFDATPDFRDVSLDVDEEDRVVEIRGPATFDVDLLAYIGATTKNSGRTVGGFGEGFKICALVGARDFGLTITAGTGAHEVAVFFDPVPLGRELCYRVTEREEPLAGSYVRLEGCDDDTLEAFTEGPSMFRHPDNPKLRQPVVLDAEHGVGVYRAPGGADGEIYYRRQLRGTTHFYGSGVKPLTLAHDGIIDALEGDRDRRDLRAEPVACAIGEKLAPDDLYKVLLELMPEWHYGHEVLNGFLDAAKARQLVYSWPPRWLARSYGSASLAQFAERQGYSIAVAGFAALGMPTPEQHYKQLETRAASPLERARFQVVADLYAELNGTPAKTTDLEVFDMAGSAVAGQHLGTKVIVGAELLAAGFDASAGTILHELSHEAGGEEDIRFLRRLTNLLGAALREPEKIREARRRYAVARPSRARRQTPPEKKSAGVQAYQPENALGHGDLDGVVCTVLVPPGFPPSQKIVEAICAAAEEVGTSVWIDATHVNGPIGAVTWRTPGVPTLYIGGIDPGGTPAESAPGYRLRTYGPEGKDLCPDAESLRAAIRRARDLKMTGRAGALRHRELTEGHVERVREALGIRLGGAREPSAKERRDAALQQSLREFVDDNGGFSLEDGFAHGQHAACAEWVRRAQAAGDGRTADELFEEISDQLNLALEHAYALEAEDPDHDDADAFERQAMLAAQGAAVSSYALGLDEADARSRAEAAFRRVRAATTRVLDLDVTIECKEVILRHAMTCAGLGWDWRPRTRSFDEARFQAGLEQAVTEGVRVQRAVDEDGGYGPERDLATVLGPLAEDPADARLRVQNQRRNARWARTTHAIKAAYDRALAASGSEVEAARAALDTAARRIPENRR